MHFYNFNINDFNASTRHLSHVERALYRDLIDMYYQNERPICADFDNLCRKLIVKSDDEKQALQNVLNDFFVIKKLKGDKAHCWHHKRIDRELKNYKFRQTPANEMTNKNQTPSNENQTPTNAATNDNQTLGDRQQAYKQKVNNLVNALRSKGINANSRMKIGELQTLFDAHCKQTSNAPTNATNEMTNATNAVSQVYNHKPITNNHKPNIKTSITQSADADAVVCAGVELNEHQAETQQKPKKASKADAWKALLAENGIVGQLADDYIAIRLAKNAPLTATAMDGLKREAAKAGMTLEQAITYSTEQGWQGFKAEWLLNKVFVGGGGNPVAQPFNKINQTPVHTQGGAFLAKDIF